MLESLFWSLRPEVCDFIKKQTETQVISREFYEIFKNIFFHRKPPVVASESYIYYILLFMCLIWDYTMLKSPS